MNLNLIDFAALSPLLILLVGGLSFLLIESFFASYAKKISFFFALITIVLALLSASTAPTSHSVLLTPWIRFDSLARIFEILFLSIGLVSIFLSAPFFQRFQASEGEYYFLLISALFGLILIGSSADFLTLFLGLETLSVALYVLCSYMKKWTLSSEAAIKYFLMGALATGFLLFGIALIYGAVGTTRLDKLLSGFQAIDHLSGKALFLSGISLVTLGLAFKAAIVPFHVWAPDVYEGAPTPVTAFMAVGTKLGAFAAFVRVFFDALPHFDALWSQGVAFLAYPTLIYANFVALRQVQLRRFFAYSGISHAGFLLILVPIGTPEALSALLFYLVVYAIATLGCFAVLACLDHQSSGVMLHDLHGLFRRSPLLTAIFTLCLLTLAGIPPTVGFFAKFYLFKVAFQAGYYGLVIVGLLTTILAVYYYLRIAAAMFTGASSESAPIFRAWPAVAVGTLALTAIVFFSWFPMPLLTLLSA